MITLLTCLKSWGAELTTALKLQGETLNFEILGQKSWDYDIQRLAVGKQTKVQLTVKGLSKESIQNLKVQTNPFVQSIQVLPNTVDSSSVIEFVLKNDQVEAFDYLTDQPSKLIVDFYLSEEAKAAPINTSKKNKVNAKLATGADKKVKTRAPADVDYLRISDLDGIETFADNGIDLRAGLFDGGDDKYKRFKLKDYEISQSAILNGLSSYYLNFPIIDQEYAFWKKMKANPPNYEIKSQNNAENKQARLLQRLFQKKRTLVLQKTFGWFEKKFPNSQYLDIGYLMTADSLIDLWRQEPKNEYFEDAAYFYDQFLKKFPESPLAERTSLALGLLNIDKKNYLEATRKLNAHIENEKYKTKISNEYAQLGLAYSLAKLKETDKAVKITEVLEEKSQNQLVKAEAAFRKADILMMEDIYAPALDQYTLAMQKYPTLLTLFPNAYFNKMEALFRTQKPEKAHAVALEFAQHFPTHEFAPYALTRVGELLEIIGTDQSKPVGAYLETHFRYGDNPKTIIARLHLLSARMKSMKEQELTETIQKMNELAVKSDLENVDQFKSVMIADGYARRTEYDLAIDILSKFYQSAPTRKDSFQVAKRIVKNIHDQIRFFSNENQHKNVLATVKKYSDTWLRKNDRIDTGFFVGIAYQSAGAYGAALKKYDKALEQLGALKNDPASLLIVASQKLPTTDEVHLQKSQCLFEEKKYQEAYDDIQKITKPELMSEAQQIQRVYLVSSIYQQKGETDLAIRYLSEVSRVWQNKPQQLAPTILKLAELEYKKLNFSKATELLKNLNEQKIDESSKLRSYQLLSKISIDAKDNPTAILALNTLLNQYEKDHSLSEERFKLGQIYFNQGDLKKAEEAWSNFKGPESAFWDKLATEKLNGSKWKQDYKKYLKRIPATAKESSGDN